MQQKVTVPASSSTSLYLPLPLLSLLCSSVLLFCQLYFPYLPLESAFFFSPFPLSFCPSPHCIISLTRYHRRCQYVRLCFKDNTSYSVPVQLLCKWGLCNRGYVQWGMARRGARIRKSCGKSCCAVLCLLLPLECSRNKGGILWVCLEPETYSVSANMD